MSLRTQVKNKKSIVLSEDPGCILLNVIYRNEMLFICKRTISVVELHLHIDQ